MMILPLADALQNCLQNLTSRIAGIDNEQMTGRVMGMGAMLGFGIGAIKEQFKTPSSKTGSVNTKSGNSDSGNNSADNGFKGFISRAKSVINPSGINLSAEKDYNGNVNPIRDNIKPSPKINSVTNSNSTVNGKSPNNMPNSKISNAMSKVKNTVSRCCKSRLWCHESIFKSRC